MQTYAILLIIIEVILLAIALSDLNKRKLKNLTFGLVWLLIILAIPVAGPVAYLFLKEGMNADRPRAFNPKFHREAKKEG